MLTAGIIAVSDFPFWEMCLRDLANHVDQIYVRFDRLTGDPAVIDALLHRGDEICRGKIARIIQTQTPWDNCNWREELLRLLDDARPDLVVALDQDEMFERPFAAELADFIRSDKMGMMFTYAAPMPTEDGKIVLNGKSYPVAPHMKLFKWKKGLSYYPYQSYAQISQYADSRLHYQAEVKIRHYCFYTKALREEKKREYIARHGVARFQEKYGSFD